MFNDLKNALLTITILTAYIPIQSALGDSTVASMSNEANENPAVEVTAPEIYGGRSAEDVAREWVQEMVSKGKLPHSEGCLPVEESIGGVISTDLTCVAIGVAEAKAQDPSFDNSFVTQRSLWAVEAGLAARTRIIESIASQITAEDVLVLPDHPISRQFDQEVRSLEAKRDQAKRALIPLLKNVDDSLAHQLEGVTLGDRTNALIEAAIKKLDETWSAESVEQDKQKRYENAKKAYSDAQGQLNTLEQQIALYKDSLKQETRSTVAVKSSMPLYGTTPLKTWESYDGEKYQVALVILWDAKSNAWARAMASGERTAEPLPPGKKTFNEYLASKDWSRVIVGRRMIDNEGQLYVMGVGSASLDSLTRREAETLANLQAQKNLVFSIFAEQDAESTAEIGAQIKGVGNETSTSAKANVAEKLMSKVENREIPGVTRVYSQPAVHALSNRKMLVSVYMVTPENLRAAMAAYSDSAITRADDRRSQADITRNHAEADLISSRPSTAEPTKSVMTESLPPNEQTEKAVEASPGVITDEDEDEDW